MLLLDECNFTMFYFNCVKKSIRSINFYNPKHIENFHNIFFKRKYRFIIIGLECTSIPGLLSELKIFLGLKCNTKVIIVSKIKWPMENQPIRLGKDVFLVGRKDISSILNVYIGKELADYFSQSINFTCSHREKTILHMIINCYGKDELCDRLNIKHKTLSSHISNMKKKSRSHNKLHLIIAFKLKHYILGITD